MDTQLHLAVKKEIEQVFGRRIISSRDCNALSEEIYHKTGSTINANTLRRFFGLVKSLYAPSMATLQILCTYCGFKSIEELTNVHSAEKTEEIILKEDHILYYLLSPFKHIQVKSINDETYRSVIKGVIVFINRYPQLADRFHIEVARTANGQNFYFEHFINYDKLNSFYGDGIGYYLAEKKNIAAQTFGHSLLVLRYWLTKNDDKLARHYQMLKTGNPEKVVDPLTCGRYFASRLFYADNLGFSTERLLAEAYECSCSLQGVREQYSLSSSFEYVFVQALVLTGHYEEALPYIQHIHDRMEEISSVDIPLIQTLNLFETLALYQSGFEEQAEKVFTRIIFSDFDFLSKKYQTIMYLWISGFFERRVEKTNNHLKELIKETGFNRFNDVIISNRMFADRL